MGKVNVVVGMQYGDEGKGKLVDFLAADADYVVRFQGGNNAGHTVVINGEPTVLHFIPSGAFHDNICVMGNGVVLDLEELQKEIEMLEAKGVSLKDRFLISENAHLILPADVEDSVHDKIGSTGKGIAPAYTNKYAKTGLRVRDILNVQRDLDEFDIKAREKLLRFKDFLLKYSYLKDQIVNVSKVLNEAIDSGKNVLFEGAQAAGLDIDHGHYPFVTSSNCTAGGACTGSGVGPTRIDKVFGVSKVYITRVDRDSASPLTTQMDEEMMDKIQKKGNEYGATTGRPRRCGWLDLEIIRKAIIMNGINTIALSKLDVLDDFDEIPVCTHYDDLGKPDYTILPGWNQPTHNVKSYDELPANCRNYISFIERKLEELTGVAVPVDIVSVGPDREHTTLRTEFNLRRSNELIRHVG